jgi:hypothetical protein
MQSLPKGKVREKEHSRCETMIVQESSVAVRSFERRQSPATRFGRSFTKLTVRENRQYFPQTGNCAPVRDAHAGRRHPRNTTRQYMG